MKCERKCVCCGSADFDRKLGYFVPYISHKIADYPMTYVDLGGGPKFQPVLFTNSLLCKTCGFVFSQIRFDDDEMNRLYSGYRGPDYIATRTYYEPGYERLSQLIGQNEKEIVNRKRKFEEFLGSDFDYKSIKSVLDYGGDKGQHIPSGFVQSTKFVYEVSGVDAIDGCQKINHLNLTVDFIMCSNVLEHIPYPVDLLGKIYNCMHKDSLLFIDVPSELNDIDKHPVAFHEHINFFSINSMSAMLEKNGFDVLKIHTYKIDLGWVVSDAIYVLARKKKYLLS